MTCYRLLLLMASFNSQSMLFLYQNAGGEEVDIGRTGQTLKRMALSGFSLQEVTSTKRKCFQNKRRIYWIVKRRHVFIIKSATGQAHKHKVTLVGDKCTSKSKQTGCCDFYFGSINKPKKHWFCSTINPVVKKNENTHTNNYQAHYFS